MRRTGGRETEGSRGERMEEKGEMRREKMEWIWNKSEKLARSDGNGWTVRSEKGEEKRKL